MNRRQLAILAVLFVVAVLAFTDVGAASDVGTAIYDCHSSTGGAAVTCG